MIQDDISDVEEGDLDRGSDESSLYEGDADDLQDEELIDDGMVVDRSVITNWRNNFVTNREISSQDEELEELIKKDVFDEECLNSEEVSEEESSDKELKGQEDQLLKALELVNKQVSEKSRKLDKREKDIIKKKGKQLEAVRMEGLEDVPLESGGYKYIYPSTNYEEVAPQLPDLDLDQIDEIEAKLLDERPWYLRGEASSADRPLDALIDLELEFPVYSQARIFEYEDSLKVGDDGEDDNAEIDQQINLIVKRRIVKRAFDNVTKRDLKPILKIEKQDLQFSESRLSLAEIYAEEYEKEILKKKGKANDSMDEQRIDIAELVEKLFRELNGLSNEFHTATRARHQASIMDNPNRNSIEFELSKKEMTTDQKKAYRRATRERKKKLKISKKHVS